MLLLNINAPFTATPTAVLPVVVAFAYAVLLLLPATDTIGGIPTGEFLEDYEYSSTGADLDEFNGRFGITPEYPSGTYYYVATVDADNKPAYPYTVGGKFAGTLQTEGPYAVYGIDNAGGRANETSNG